MNKEEWTERIIQCCKDAGTYQPFYMDVIETLARVLEDRDKAEEQYIQTGSNPTITRIGDRNKEKYIAKNPVLIVRNELNTQALALWRDLGLTPKGLKQLSSEVVTSNKETSFEKLLKGLENG